MSEFHLSRRLVLLGAACLPTTGLHAHSQRRIKTAALYALPFEHLWVSRIHSVLTQANKNQEITYQGFENLRAAEVTPLLRKLGREGCELVFGESSQFDEHEIRAIAREFPRMSFVWWSLGLPQAPNFSVYENCIYEPAYLAGMLGAGLSSSKHLGLVGGFDMPHTRTIMHAYMAGARAIEPKVSFSVGVVNSWFHQVRASRMTEAMLAKGADTFLATTHAGVIETAAEHQALAFNCMSNQQDKFPSTVVAAVLWHMEPVIEQALQRLRTGAFRAESYPARMQNKGASLSPLNYFESKVPPELLKRVREREAEILSGSFVVPKSDRVTYTMS